MASKLLINAFTYTLTVALK